MKLHVVVIEIPICKFYFVLEICYNLPNIKLHQGHMWPLLKWMKRISLVRFSYLMNSCRIKLLKLKFFIYELTSLFIYLKYYSNLAVTSRNFKTATKNNLLVQQTMFFDCFFVFTLIYLFIYESNLFDNLYNNL